MALTAWNEFVTKVFKEGREKNSAYKFKDALKDASRRKSEMKKNTNTAITRRSSKRNKSRKHKKQQ
jgi:hypothetical protein